jgi:predicted negative regulator of RcsB-dependent stress response
MASPLDLQEQEQLDQLKAFWKRYGNWLTWLLIVVAGALAAWNGWNWWQRDQAVKAGSMFDQLDRAAQAGDADQAGRVFADMKERYPGTAFTQQGALLTAKVDFEKGQREAALAALGWVADHGADTAYPSIARLRAAGILLDEKKYDEALKQIDAVTAPEFAALAADRRGDVLLAQGKKDEAKAAYLKAWNAMDPSVGYRRLIDAKLTALGAAPSAASAVVEAAK